uniref:Capsid protein n=1 Tax=Cressdnaviricota sp. TaxID=2748378 RepID=A0A6M4B6S9_9VIRU|nr:capsid protein [Cressdnaviricota sp.]
MLISPLCIVPILHQHLSTTSTFIANLDYVSTSDQPQTWNNSITQLFAVELTIVYSLLTNLVYNNMQPRPAARPALSRAAINGANGILKWVLRNNPYTKALLAVTRITDWMKKNRRWNKRRAIRQARSIHNILSMAKNHKAAVLRRKRRRRGGKSRLGYKKRRQLRRRFRPRMTIKRFGNNRSRVNRMTVREGWTLTPDELFYYPTTVAPTTALEINEAKSFYEPNDHKELWTGTVGRVKLTQGYLRFDIITLNMPPFVWEDDESPAGGAYKQLPYALLCCRFGHRFSAARPGIIMVRRLYGPSLDSCQKLLNEYMYYRVARIIIRVYKHHRNDTSEENVYLYPEGANPRVNYNLGSGGIPPTTNGSRVFGYSGEAKDFLVTDMFKCFSSSNPEMNDDLLKFMKTNFIDKTADPCRWRTHFNTPGATENYQTTVMSYTDMYNTQGVLRPAVWRKGFRISYTPNYKMCKFTNPADDWQIMNGFSWKLRTERNLPNYAINNDFNLFYKHYCFTNMASPPMYIPLETSTRDPGTDPDPNENGLCSWTFNGIDTTFSATWTSNPKLQNSINPSNQTGHVCNNLGTHGFHVMGGFEAGQNTFNSLYWNQHQDPYVTIRTYYKIIFWGRTPADLRLAVPYSNPFPGESGTPSSSADAVELNYVVDGENTKEITPEEFNAVENEPTVEEGVIEDS